MKNFSKTLNIAVSVGVLFTCSAVHALSLDLVKILDSANPTVPEAVLGITTDTDGYIASIYAQGENANKEKLVTIPVSELRTPHSVIPGDKRKLAMATGLKISNVEVLLSIRYLQDAIFDGDKDRKTALLRIRYNQQKKCYEAIDEVTGRPVTKALVKVQRNLLGFKVGIEKLILK